MKDIIICIMALVIIWLFLMICAVPKGSLQAPDIPVETITAPAKQVTLDDLLDAIEQAESGGDANAVGDGGKAIGSFQIHKIYVDDVNRIIGAKFYNYEDRWNPEKSRLMAKTYMHHYMRNVVNTTLKPPYELMARIHNGGPNGWKKESTKAYWLKVKQAIKEAGGL